jgi:hypothetical protein
MYVEINSLSPQVQNQFGIFDVEVCRKKIESDLSMAIEKAVD